MRISHNHNLKPRSQEGKLESLPPDLSCSSRFWIEAKTQSIFSRPSFSIARTSREQLEFPNHLMQILTLVLHHPGSWVLLLLSVN